MLLVAAPAASAKLTRLSDDALSKRIDRTEEVVRQHRTVVRFFVSNSWLLTHPVRGLHSRSTLARSQRAVSRAQERLRSLRTELKRRGKSAAGRPGGVEGTICRVFGSYCRQALAVVRCESGFRTDAQNGQYLGLFQMGSYARQLYGHGSGVETQARAAYRYFVDSGRDWSPWSCKPW